MPKPTPTPPSYSSFVSDFRELVRQGDAAKLKRMFLLVETKPLDAVWRMGPYNSWRKLLQEEQLCPLAYYDAFEVACQVFKRSVIEKIGADAAVVLARVEEPIRDAVLKRVLSHIEVRRVPPSRQIIWGYVRSMRLIPHANMKPTQRTQVRH